MMSLVGQRVVRPVPRGNGTPLSASSTEDLPEDWSPITAICGTDKCLSTLSSVKSSASCSHGRTSRFTPCGNQRPRAKTSNAQRNEAKYEPQETAGGSGAHIEHQAAQSKTQLRRDVSLIKAKASYYILGCDADTATAELGDCDFAASDATGLGNTGPAAHLDESRLVDRVLY
jgi:hypothetical protein